jgi:hypothetical protein
MILVKYKNNRGFKVLEGARTLGLLKVCPKRTAHFHNFVLLVRKVPNPAHFDGHRNNRSVMDSRYALKPCTGARNDLCVRRRRPRGR